MVITIAPEWLTTRGGELKASANGQSWSIAVGGNLLYVLTLAPAGGKFGCRVVQAHNGVRLDKGKVWATAGEATSGGLDDLRAALGW